MNKYLELLDELNKARFIFKTDEEMLEYIDTNMEDEKKELVCEYIKIRDILSDDEKKLIHELFKRFGIIQKI